MTFQSNNNPIGSLDDGGRVASTGHGVPVFLLHVLATAQTDQIIGSQVRSGLAGGGSRIRTLGPPSAAGKDAPVWHRAPAAPPKAVSLAPVLAEPDADPVAVAPDGIEQQREVTTKEVC